MKQFAVSLLALSALAAFGCSEQAQTVLEPDQALFARPGGGGGSGGGGGLTSECGGSTALLDSRAELNWGTSHAIRNDEAGAYRGGSADGVHAKIFYHDGGCSRSGDMVFDVDMGKKNGTRRLVFLFPETSPIGHKEQRSAPFVNFRQLMQLGSDVNTDGWLTGGRDKKIEEKDPGSLRGREYPDDFATRPNYPETLSGAAPPFRIGTEAAGCETLEYAEITLRRTGGVEGFQKVEGLSSDLLEMGQWEHASEYPAGTWVVEGQTAQCLKSVKGGKLEPNGGPFLMPFSVTVIEVRQ